MWGRASVLYLLLWHEAIGPTLSLIISSNSSSRPGQLNPSLFPVKAFCKWIGKGLRSEPLWSQRNRELSSDLWGKLTGKDAGERET